MLRSALGKVNLSSWTLVDLKLIWGNLSWIWQLLFLSCIKFWYYIGWLPALVNCLYIHWPKACIHTALAFFLSLSLIEKISISGGTVNGFFMGFSSSSSGLSAKNGWGCRRRKAEYQDPVQRDFPASCLKGGQLCSQLQMPNNADSRVGSWIGLIRSQWCNWDLCMVYVTWPYLLINSGFQPGIFVSLELFYLSHLIMGRRVWIQSSPLT